MTGGFWAGLALPGVVWLVLFFLLPFYVILGVAFGTVDPILSAAVPEWNPLEWNSAGSSSVFERLFAGRRRRSTSSCGRSSYVAISLATLRCSSRIPVAYYVARYGGRWKGLLLVGLIAPFFISYLMRMLAWINLLQDDGWVNDVLDLGRSSTAAELARRPRSSVILGLVYGYVPFMILPLYAFLDRIDRASSKRRVTSARARSRRSAW